MKPADMALADGNHCDLWYDRHTKCWVVQVKDFNGNQIGDASFFHNREEACVEVGYHALMAEKAVAQKA